MVLCGISPPFERLSPSSGQITHVLLTRAPLYRGLPPFSCDLHVLGAPLTFALSQDQTLQLNFSIRETSCPVSQRSSLRELITGQIGRVALITPVILSDAGSVHLPKRYDVSRASVRAGDLVREPTDSTCNQVFKDRASCLARGADEALDQGLDFGGAGVSALLPFRRRGDGVYRRPSSLSNFFLQRPSFFAAGCVALPGVVVDGGRCLSPSPSGVNNFVYDFHGGPENQPAARGRRRVLSSRENLSVMSRCRLNSP